jgi:rare lipoprotein A
MARRHVLPFALAALVATTAHAAPANELAGGIAATPSSSPVSVQAFLQRMRQPVAAAPAASAPGGYVPRTAHDNSPYRFDMTQNGRRMTAEEFDAWMKARGIRVATGKPAGSEPAAAAPAAATAQACQPTATTSC